jgi:hypothetical protein
VLDSTAAAGAWRQGAPLAACARGRQAEWLTVTDQRPAGFRAARGGAPTSVGARGAANPHGRKYARGLPCDCESTGTARASPRRDAAGAKLPGPCTQP